MSTIDVFSRLATVAIFSPSRRSRMIFARKRSRCALVGALALRCSSARISAPAVISRSPCLPEAPKVI